MSCSQGRPLRGNVSVLDARPAHVGGMIPYIIVRPKSEPRTAWLAGPRSAARRYARLRIARGSCNSVLGSRLLAGVGVEDVAQCGRDGIELAAQVAGRGLGQLASPAGGAKLGQQRGQGVAVQFA